MMSPLNWHRLLANAALTCKELASRCGVTEQTMSEWLKGAEEIVEERYHPEEDVKYYSLKEKSV